MSLRIEKRDVAWETRIKDERTSGFFLWLQHLEVASTHAAKILSRRLVKRNFVCPFDSVCTFHAVNRFDKEKYHTTRC